LPPRPFRAWSGRATLVLAAIGLVRCGGREPGAVPETRAPAASVEPEPAEEAEEMVRWLPRHQSADGRWEAAAFDRGIGAASAARGDAVGRGRPEHDGAVTALAVLALVELGRSPTDRNCDGRALAWGLHWLLSSQAADGALARPSVRGGATHHALATLALVHAAERSRSPALVDAARNAAAFYAASREGGERAWDDERGPGDLPPFAWMALAADAAARLAAGAPPSAPEATSPSLTGLERDPVLLRMRGRVAAWLTLEPAKRTVARVGLALVLARRPGKEWKKRPEVVEAAAWLAGRAPAWDPRGAGVDLTGWWLATEGLCASGGEAWNTWNKALTTAVVETQHEDTDFCRLKGSWDPAGTWSDAGGRVFSTATSLLVLLEYYRYPGVLGAAPEGSRTTTAPPPPPPPPGLDALPDRRFAACSKG
jgi:hypothetical protein